MNNRVSNVKKRYDLCCDIEKSDGYIEWQKFIKSRMSYLIYLDNNRQFKLSLKLFRGNNRLSLMEIEGSRHRNQRMLIRNLFNVIGAGFSFIDHLNFRNKFQYLGKDATIPVLFRYIRNFIVHENTFPLISKEVLIESEYRTFQTMDIGLFLGYLKKRKEEESLNCARRSKEKQIAVIVDYVLTNMVGTSDFEELYDKYLDYITDYHKRWVYKHIKEHRILFNTLLLDVKEFKRIVFDNDQNKDIGLYILSNEKIRYLKILLGKKA